MTDESEVIAALERAPSVASLLSTFAEAVVGLLECEACLVSRAIGDMLVDLVEYSPMRDLPGGHGYLISEYPATQRVLDDRTRETVHVGDADADAQEVKLLRTLGFASLLMVPLVVDGKTWGLVEAYGDRPFTEDDTARIAPLVARAADLIPRLQS